MKLTKIIITTFVIIFLIFLIIVFLNLQPVDRNNTQNFDFVIAPQEKTLHIAQRLEESGLIRNKYIFLFYIYKDKPVLKAGKFSLSPSLNVSNLITEITTGGSHDYWLKIIEGQRVEELDLAFSKKDEGYLFPDSYLIPDYYSLDQTTAVIKDNFVKKFDKAKKDSVVKLSDEEIVIFASLLEREGKSLESKQMIAGILFNRLDINMGLQVDASIQYIRDSQQKPDKYWTKLIKANMSIDSPYNTYKYRGLPPTPICNPGYNSIYATFHPTESDYVYYITSNDGQMYYAKSLDEHNLNVANYLK
jgi:UPF0755 protein